MEGIKIMKHFKKNGEIFAFEMDGSQDHLIQDGMEPITVAERDAMLAPTPEEVEQQESEQAKAELAQIDLASVRSLREFVLAKFAGDPALPPYLETHEADAQIKRTKIK